MNLVSIYFLIFLIAVLTVYYIVPKKVQYIVLLTASYTFYLFAGVTPLIFVLTTTITAFAAGIVIGGKQEISHAAKCATLTAAVIINIGIFCVLRYLLFSSDIVNPAFEVFRYDTEEPLINLIIPMGLVFYTFQAIGYLADVYKGKQKPERNFFRFALFISFFPQVVQGPISRYEDLGKQLKTPHKAEYRNLAYGAQLILWGFIKKLVIADRANMLTSPLFTDYSDVDGLLTAAGIMAYAIQIYADFSGGIDIARGAARMLGIDLIENFRRPYFAHSLLEYWKRWNTSLTEWMNDYVYSPAAGSSGHSRKARQTAALFVTMLLIGLWYGFDWNYLLFGVFNALIVTISLQLMKLYRCAYKALHINPNKFIWRSYQIIRTFLIICIGLTIMRSGSPNAAIDMLINAIHCFSMDSVYGFLDNMITLGFDGDNLKVLLLGIVVMFTVDVMQERGLCIRDRIASMCLPVRWAIYLFGFAVVLILGVYGPTYATPEFIFGFC